MIPFFSRVLEQIIEKQSDASEPLDGSDQQFGKRLPAALSLTLTHFQKSVKSGIVFVTFFESFFRVLEKVHKGRVGFQKVICEFEQHVTNSARLSPILEQGQQIGQHLGMNLIDRRHVAKDNLHLRLVQKLVFEIFQGIFKHFDDGLQNSNVILFRLHQLHKHLLSGRDRLGLGGGRRRRRLGLFLGRAEPKHVLFVGRVEDKRAGGGACKMKSVKIHREMKRLDEDNNTVHTERSLNDILKENSPLSVYYYPLKPISQDLPKLLAPFKNKTLEVLTSGPVAVDT